MEKDLNSKPCALAALIVNSWTEPQDVLNRRAAQDSTPRAMQYH